MKRNEKSENNVRLLPVSIWTKRNNKRDGKGKIEGGGTKKRKHVEAKRWKGAVWRTLRQKIKRQNCNRSNNGTSARDYIHSLCVTRHTDLTTRFTKESYLFLLVYNRAPNDSKWNPFLFESAIPIPPRVVSKDARFTAKQIQLKKKNKEGEMTRASKYIYSV